jgi:hypothetical protein
VHVARQRVGNQVVERPPRQGSDVDDDFGDYRGVQATQARGVQATQAG